MPSVTRGTSPSPSAPNGSVAAHNPSLRVVSGGASGKSSQYIERLSSEVDKLKRDAKAKELALEEARRELKASKAIERDCRSENERLNILQESHDRTMKRKDRQLEESRAQLQAETQRRIAATLQADEMSTELGKTLEDSKRAVAEAVTAQKRAETHAEALRDGISRLRSEYEGQVQRLNKQMEEVMKGWEEGRKRLAALEVSGDHQHQEKAHSDGIVKSMSELMEDMKLGYDTRVRELEEEVADMRSKVEEWEHSAQALNDEMTAARDKMRWVVGVKNTLER